MTQFAGCGLPPRIMALSAAAGDIRCVYGLRVCRVLECGPAPQCDGIRYL